MTTPELDGNIQAATTHLHHIINTLINPQWAIADKHPAEIPSLYHQLYDSAAGQQGSGNHTPKSTPPLWIDAEMLLTRIDTTARKAWPPTTPHPTLNPTEPPTIHRLTWLTHQTWRPQDTTLITDIANQLEQFTADADMLLNPTRRWTLPNPCPACQTAVVYRRDTAGDTIRQPALQITDTGCQCQKCRTVWSPDKYIFLARLLGCVPDNVLE